MKEKIIMVVMIIILLVVVIGVSYASFSYSGIGSYENKITTGEISMSYQETSNVINMNRALPTTDTTGKASLVEGEYFDFSVTTHIVGDTNINWEISAKALDSNTFDGSNIRLYLTRLEDGEEVQVMAPTNYSENSTSNSYTGRPANEMSLLLGSTSEQGDVTTTYRLRMWVDEDYNPQGDTGGKTFAVEVNVYGKQGDVMPLPAVRTLLAKANGASITNYKDGNTTEMYTFTHEAGEQQSGWTKDELTDYRYIGANPNNYVSFNNELWRIIGVFTVEGEDGNKEQRMKIIRNESIRSMAWNSNYNNNWQTASLNTYLNGEYYNSLSSEAQSMIVDTKYYLGGISNEIQSAAGYYVFERGIEVYNSNPVSWIGKIGLMYPSDYVYTYGMGVDNQCYRDPTTCAKSAPESGYLYNGSTEWLITPGLLGGGGSVFYLLSVGNITYDDMSIIDFARFRPTLYLSSNVCITKGSGTSSDPYILQ